MPKYICDLTPEARSIFEDLKIATHPHSVEVEAGRLEAAAALASEGYLVVVDKSELGSKDRFDPPRAQPGWFECRLVE